MNTGAMYPNRPTGALVARAQSVLGMTHEQFGTALGASKRTAARWAAGRSEVSMPGLHLLAQLVYARDPSLAEEIASAANETLVSLGIVPPPAPPQPPSIPANLAVDAVVCAAADALDAAPRTVRAALVAAFRRARELKLTVEEVEKALAPAVSPPPPISKA